jgi:hypothetical protein
MHSGALLVRTIVSSSGGVFLRAMAKFQYNTRLYDVGLKNTYRSEMPVACAGKMGLKVENQGVVS